MRTQKTKVNRRNQAPMVRMTCAVRKFLSRAILKHCPAANILSMDKTIPRQKVSHSQDIANSFFFSLDVRCGSTVYIPQAYVIREAAQEPNTHTDVMFAFHGSLFSLV